MDGTILFLAKRRCVAAVRILSSAWSVRRAYDRVDYCGRNTIERMICRLNDFRRIASRQDKRTDTDLAAVIIAAASIWSPNRERIQKELLDVHIVNAVCSRRERRWIRSGFPCKVPINLRPS